MDAVRRLVIGVVAVGLAASGMALGAAVSSVGDARVVEGHTVWAVAHTDGAAATTVEVAPVMGAVASAADAPGGNGSVLWLDDSYLHSIHSPWGTFPSPPAAALAVAARDAGGEFACDGAVWAVPAGVALNPTVPVEDYHIWDPNGISWLVTKYRNGDALAPDGAPGYAWAVEVYGPQHSESTTPSPHGSTGCFVTDASGPYTHDDGTSREAVEYNALLWLFVDDLPHPGGLASHGEDAPAALGQGGATSGNSHPYNPTTGDAGAGHVHGAYAVDLHHRTPLVLSSGATVFSSNLGGFHGH